ncbi:multiple sugar transport system substrate-binding protein [Anaerotaenia torta]|uniref:extracellular solute-binding protein n=1 Tax=Anaerotaenia torta TaxID=433293 RepID=UPI003D231F97
MKRGKVKVLSCLLAVVMLAAMTMTGCSSPGKGNEEVALKFWSIYPEGDANYEWTLSVIKRFEETHENIRIEYTGISFWDYFTKITTAMTDSNGPDIYIQTIKDTADRAKGGVSMELSQFFDETLKRDNFYEADLKPMTYEEKLYGLPYALDNRVLYYNVDLLNELAGTSDADWLATKAAGKENSTVAGKPDDLVDDSGNVRAPQTWDELMAYQELLTRQQDGRITQLGFDVSVGNCMFVNAVWSKGGEFFDADGNPTITTDPGVRAGFEAWYGLTHTLPFAKVNAFLDSAGDNKTNLFWSGKVAMMIATNEIPWQNDKLEEGKRIPLGAAPVPYDRIEENHYNFSGGFSVEVSNRLSGKNKAKQEAAWEFVKYLCGTEIQKEVLTKSSNMPANIAVYDELFKEITDPVKTVVLKEMSFRKAYDYIYNAPNWWGEVQGAVTDMVSDKYTVDQALQNAEKAIEKLKTAY